VCLQPDLGLARTRSIHLTGSRRRFTSTFVEPVSHTILYGIVKAWLDLIRDPGNGIFINGVRFLLSGSLLDKFNDVIEAIQLTSAYNRPALAMKSKADG